MMPAVFVVASMLNIPTPGNRFPASRLPLSWSTDICLSFRFQHI